MGIMSMRARLKPLLDFRRLKHTTFYNLLQRLIADSFKIARRLTLAWGMACGQ